MPHFGLELPPHGLSLSVWRETSLGFSLETDLQPFIALILSLLHDVSARPRRPRRARALSTAAPS